MAFFVCFFCLFLGPSWPGSLGRALLMLFFGPHDEKWAAETNQRKEAILSKNDDFGKLSKFPEHTFSVGHFSENELVLFGALTSKTIRGPIWRPEDQFGGIW